MARPGRKRKQGVKRTPTGRISRAGQRDHSFDRGSEWVQSMRAKYGEHYNSALGRAFVHGLLGEGQEANDRYAEAKRFGRLYARLIDQDRYRCALDRTPRGNLAVAVDLDQLEWEQDQQRWLMDAIDKIDATGCRPFFDQLLGAAYTDRGPYWLDNLLNGGKHPADVAVLNAALLALDAIVPARPSRILVA